MQEQSTTVKAATAASINLLKKCLTKRARDETRKRIKQRQKLYQSKKKKIAKKNVSYTKHHRNNALD